MITLPALKSWVSRQVIGPADMNSQVYDVHNALYTVANDHENAINQLRANPVISLTLQNPVIVDTNQATTVYWNTNNPIAKVGYWNSPDGGTLIVPESGVYRITMSWGGWGYGTSTPKVRAWVYSPAGKIGGFLYPPIDGNAGSNSFTMAVRLRAGEAFAAYVVSWWAPFRSDNGPGDERESWNLTAEKIAD
ncbi:hypothetical protein [Kitasatospora sp. NPDC096204]|uniref:hypothetical protein n=1 Tax=Kitasatospora sp. NPDC096204 TaxID=3364094 RepID=UPI00380FBD34